MSTPPLVLVIDDLPQNVEILGECLSDTCEIQCAFSGPEGLALVAAAPPDLILLDVMMPGMDGYAVCDRLRRDPHGQEVPVIFVTAKNDAESESRALAAGAVDFIHKPINRDVVRARVGLHLTLKARERELRAINAELERRVEERTRDLRDALVRAESAHRAKSRFLANINHELRTPMNAILGLSDLLARQTGEPGWRERAGKIAAAGRQLLGVIDDIIAMSDLEAGRIELDSVDFAPADWLEATLVPWRERAAAKGLALEWTLDPALPAWLRGDPARLGQVLDILVGNAVKFSEQGRIQVRARAEAGSGRDPLLRIEVEDQGIGIEAERQAAIFDIFEQADNSRTRRHGGAGLGLAIAGQWAELMGGGIGVHSTPGRGSLFWTTSRLEPGTAITPVPVPPTHPPAARPSLDGQQIRPVLVPLIGFLAGGDIQAYMIWEKNGPLLDGLLGECAPAFGEAMRNFDFLAALGYLREARAAFPGLEADGVHGG